MDATEKIARVVHDSINDRNCECNPVEVGSMGMEASRALLAAFPQLALEGHEENGERLAGGIIAPHFSSAPVSHKRTVYTSPWQEVQP